MTQRLPQGHVTKLQAVYERPFWRADGLNGAAIIDGGPLNITFDSSPETGSPACCSAFAGGDEGRRLEAMPAAQRRAAAPGSVARAQGPRALSPIDYVEMNWSAEPWSRGCPVAVAPPGVLTTYGSALREPIGRIHCAGTETATYWNGYIDGAVSAGLRAARAVLDAL